MIHVIIDLEFNSLPKLVKENTNPKFKKCPWEIIELGAVKLNEDFEQIDTFRMFVKPVIFYHIDKYIKTKTHLTDKDLQYGFSFQKVLSNFIQWLGDDYILYTWAKDDWQVMKMNCEYHKVDYSWFNNCVDLQEQYKNFSHSDSIRSVRNAMIELNIPSKKFHHALVDAFNEAEILKYINNKFVLQIDDVYNIKEVSIEESQKILCPKCHKELVIDHKKKSVSKKHHLYTICNDCNLKLERIIHKIDVDNNTAYIQTQLLDDKNYNDIISKANFFN